ncbi:MAG: metallophosphoesterase, partial [Spirochaetota bacterium]
MKELFTIAHITDFHVGREINFPSGKIDLYDELLQTARKLVSMDPLPDLVMVGGDLANHGVDSDYMRVKKVLDEMNLPYCLVVGNHDSRSKMRAIFSEHSRLHTQSEYIQYVIENTPLRIIVLDTLA